MLQNKGIEHVRSMVISAMLTALSVLLTRFVSPQIGDAMRFSFGTIPIMLAGIISGAIYGFAVGIAADLIGFLISPMGTVYILGLTVCSGLMGLVTPIVYKYLSKLNKTVSLGISVLLSELTVSAVLKSLCLMQAYGGAFEIYFWPKLLAAVVMAATEMVVIGALLKALERTGFYKSK